MKPHRTLIALFCLAGLTVTASEVPASAGQLVSARDADHGGRILVTVNGHPITEDDLEFLMVSRRVPEEMRPRLQKPLLDQLIDARLMRAFLAERKTEASPLELEAEVRRIRELIEKGGDRPDEVLGRLGFTEQTLREELALPLAWRAYARLLITPNRLREYFAKHRRRFDGTQVRARQVFVKAGTDEERRAALETLAGAREQIAAGKLTFAEAALQHSQAPSATAAGDVGWFPFRGKMPHEFSRVAFELKRGEVSQPFATSFGIHLVTVTDEQPGDLSLEDVRREVFAEFSQELWDEIVKTQRSAAKIEWKVDLTEPGGPGADRR